MSGIQKYGIYDTLPEGDLVTYADHEAALAKQREEMIARIEGLKQGTKQHPRFSDGLKSAYAYNDAIDDALAAIKEVDQ